MRYLKILKPRQLLTTLNQLIRQHLVAATLVEAVEGNDVKGATGVNMGHAYLAHTIRGTQSTSATWHGTFSVALSSCRHSEK